MGRLIAFSGTHGTGKTTAVFAEAHRQKLAGVNEVGLITETARDCPYQILARDHRPELAAQMWIFSAQIVAELSALARYPVTVSDRTAVDAAAYSAACGYFALARSQMDVLCAHAPIAYKTIYFMAIADHDHLVDDGVRALGDPGLRSRVETNLLEMYAELGIKVERWKS